MDASTSDPSLSFAKAKASQPEGPFNHLSQQLAFRTVLDSFSYPGTIEALPGSPASLYVLSAVADGHSSFHDQDKLLGTDTKRLLGAKEAGMADEADFLLARGDLEPDGEWQPRLGTLVDPHLGATLVLQCEQLGTPDVDSSVNLRIEGPGVPDFIETRVAGLHPDWIEHRSRWVRNFPLGVDVLLVDRTQVLGLPRTSVISIL